MAKKLILDPILACLAHICAPQHFFAGLVRHCSYYYLEQFKGKIMNQTLENDKKPNFGLHFGPNLVLIFFLFFFFDFTSTTCYTLLEAISVCTFKEN